MMNMGNREIQKTEGEWAFELYCCEWCHYIICYAIFFTNLNCSHKLDMDEHFYCNVYTLISFTVPTCKNYTYINTLQDSYSRGEVMAYHLYMRAIGVIRYTKRFIKQSQFINKADVTTYRTTPNRAKQVGRR